MARRSSARLRNRNSSTPKRVSLSHDAQTRTPRTAPVKLSTLREDGEMPGAFPSSASPPSRESLNDVNEKPTTVPVKFSDGTPKNATPIKPAEDEMHPKQHQQSTAKPLEKARWLGFSNVAPHTEPPKQASKIATLQGTPTRALKSGNIVGSPKFRFTFGREQSLELSPEAKKLMDEKREEAAKIRDLMIANSEGPEDVAEAVQRKIAMPKGKKGRFSEVHMEQFKKMDSIASHPSAIRADPNKSKTDGTFAKPHADARAPQQTAMTPSKSLKRSPSKAQLDEPDMIQQTLPRSISKPILVHPASNLPRSASSKNLHVQTSTEESSPTKRVKRSATDDVSIARPSSSDSEKPLPATPQPKKSLSKQPNDIDMSTFTSPTQASLARTASMKSTQSSKIPAPMLSRSPSKPSIQDENHDSPKTSTLLLARSPAKISLFSKAEIEKPKAMMSPLLIHTPSKASPFKKVAEPGKKEDEKVKEAPLLSRTPLKMSKTKNSESEAAEEKPSSSIPLLNRSPAKISLPKTDADSQFGQTPGKSTGSNIMGRFNLLRSSPMKSILRSPQRLYSNDPAKVAAGTHLASPADIAVKKGKGLFAVKEATTSVEKHVDFTSSTKARYERAQSEATSTPSKGPTPPPKDGSTEGTPSPKPAFAEYPSLPSDEIGTVVTPQKRRQTAAPYDFTFTSHGNGIIFGQSPNAPASAANRNCPSTIRHVSAEPQFPPPTAPATGSKKRKFDSENDKAIDEEGEVQMSDKENAAEGEEERPAKRMRPNAPEQIATKPATRLPTLGVKPKKTAKDTKDGKPKTISKARLTALAQPKRRG